MASQIHAKGTQMKRNSCNCFLLVYVKRGPNGLRYHRHPGGIKKFMNLDQLSDEELKDLVLKKQLEYIKICQDDFLAFARAVWQDFIYRKTDNPKKYGHHQ